VNPQTLRCQKVSDDCNTWNTLGQCVTCYQGYRLSGTACIVNSQVVVNTNTQSTTVNNQNTNINNNNGGAIILSSSDNNCRTPLATGGCQVCYPSFYYNQEAGRCVTVNPLCKTWNNLGHCLSCYEGYYITSNTCIIQANYQGNLVVGSNDIPANQDPFCNQYSQGVCVKCATRTYMDPTTQICTQIDANCANWNSANGVCNSCYSGYEYVVQQNRCRLMNPEVTGIQLKSDLNTDVSCRTSDDNGRCTQCIFRYVLNQNATCIKVSDLCKTWSETTAQCTSCYGGYTRTNQGQCIV
jgi:hypothetical protein